MAAVERRGRRDLISSKIILYELCEHSSLDVLQEQLEHGLQPHRLQSMDGPEVRALEDNSGDLYSFPGFATDIFHDCGPVTESLWFCASAVKLG